MDNNADLHRGLVLRTTGSWYRVLTDSSSELDCRLRGNYRLRGNKQTNPIAVGDWVQYTHNTDGTGTIHEVEDRNNYIVRRATKLSKQTHVIAANIDRLCIVATLGMPRTSTGFIDRMLVTAEAYHIPACIVMNKIDLYDEELWQIHRNQKAIYETIGYPVIEVSAKEKTGFDILNKLIDGKVVLFSGHSGVGKSAIINTICPTLNLRVGDISAYNMKGRHTTTFAEIFPIRMTNGSTTMLIDTPGIKEFGMVDFNAQELSHFFPEMRQRLHNCHFANCTHTHEPQCAIKQAVEKGEIDTERYNSYINILNGIEE